METSTEQPLELGISGFEEQKQYSTLRSDTLVNSNSPGKAASNTSSVKAATPIPTVDLQGKTESNTPSVKAATPTPQVDSLQISTNGDSKSMDIGPAMSGRNLRKRKEPPAFSMDPVNEALKPLTDEQRQNWKGWVELESDPVSSQDSQDKSYPSAIIHHSLKTDCDS